MTETQLKKILRQCKECKKKDKKYERSCMFIKTMEPGERVGIDILEVTQGRKVVVAVDYFSRIVFAECIPEKSATEILKFLEKLQKRLPMKSLISDNGREFSNASVREFCKSNRIEHILSIPYYHQSNGRIERTIRTIRNALRKTAGPLKMALLKAVENYNRTIHRAIGMSPIEANKKENIRKVIEHQERYLTEFKNYNTSIENFREGDRVLIRNELKKT